MIKNEQQLDIVKQQLERVESALGSIKREVQPKSEARFRLMAEGYFDQINQLRAQIDEYLGLASVAEAQTDLVIGLSGKSVQLGETRVSLVTRTLDIFRRGLQELMVLNQGESVISKGGGRRKGWIEKLCDPPLIGLSRGSLRIHLGEPFADEQLLSGEDRRMYQSTLNRLVEGLAWASESEHASPDRDPKAWHAVLGVVRKLVPPRDGEVEEISFAGRIVGVGRRFALSKATRNRVDAELKRVTTTEEYSEVEGTIREVDLDKGTFQLRERPDDLLPLECEYDELVESEVKAYLDSRVVVAGVLRSSAKTHRQIMEVETIEPLTSETPADQTRT